MSSYFALLGAIVFEVLGTLLLPVTKEFTATFPTIIMSVSYIASFYFLTLAIKTIPLAIVYACWSGVGILAIAVLSLFYLRTDFKLAVHIGNVPNSKWSYSC